MKSIFVLLIASIAYATPALSQTPADSSAAQPESVAQRGKHFVDENGDGIDDRLEAKGNNMRRRGKDRFIDEDGDGICDGRERGIGFRGGRSEGGKGGARQQGGGKK